MDDRRQRLTAFVTRNAEGWAGAVPADRFGGELRIETRNTVYQFRDGVCVAVARRTTRSGHPAGEWRQSPTSLVGMRLLGWLAPSEQGGLLDRWRPGSYAVLFRPRAEGGKRNAVALTSATTGCFKSRPRMSSPAPSSRPAGATTSRPALTVVPSPRSAVPPPPPSVVRPAPPSGTRLHRDVAPAAVAARCPDSVRA